MKRKSMFLPILALALGVSAAFAFQHSPSAAGSGKTLANSVWEYDGSGDPTDPSNYTKVTGTFPQCEGTSEVCVIEAPAQSSNSQLPQIDATLESEINAALQQQQNQDHVTLRD